MEEHAAGAPPEDLGPPAHRFIAAAAIATRASVSSGSRSMGVPSAAFSRYFMSQIWREISLMASVSTPPTRSRWRPS